MLGYSGSNPARLRRLALAAVMLLGAGALLPARADPARFLTFIEVQSDASSRAQAILRDYARVLRRGVSSDAGTSHGATSSGTIPPGALWSRPSRPPRAASMAAGAVILQEVDRPGRFVLLERAADTATLTQLERRARPVLQSLDALLIAPLDRRAYRELDTGCREGGRSAPPPPSAASAPPVVAAEAGSTGPGAPRPLYVIAHLDIAGPMRPGPADTLARLAGAACRSPGSLGFEVWQQLNRGNHFNLVVAWSRRRDLDAFAASRAAREFRQSVGPWIGSPYDERLYRALQAE